MHIGADNTRQYISAIFGFSDMVFNISVMTLLMRIAVNFRGSIATSFPQIIDLLKDDNPGAREASVNVLLELSEHSM